MLEFMPRRGGKSVLAASYLPVSHEMLVHCSVFQLSKKPPGNKAPEVIRIREQQTLSS